MKRILIVVTVFLVTTLTSFAQGTRGTIKGIVTDPNGAVVANATVRLVNAAKGSEVRVDQTNSEGLYQFLEIEPDNYNINVSSSGFTESQLVDVKVEPNRNVQADVKLSIGGGTTEVTVTAATELIDRESPTLGTTVDNRRIIGLPLNGRNVLDLATTQPGVVTNSPSTGFGGGSGFRVNGQRAVENNISLDGATNNEVAVGSTIGAQPRPDAVQEFRLLTSNYEAEFGRNTGAIVNVVTRSGTNDYHGNGRFFYRPTELSAARFLDKATAAPGTPNLRRKFDRKEYGFNIGGPVRFLNFGEGVPIVYNGQDKTFFFTDYEHRYQLLGDTRTISGLPTAAERAGDFSRRTSPIIDPATGQPFPGNIIPTSRISPIARYYLGFIPAADASGQARVSANDLVGNNYFTLRLDQNFSKSNQLSYTYNFFNSNDAVPFAFGGASVPGFGSSDLRRTDNHVVRLTSVITPKLVNSFLFSYSRNNQPGVAPNNKTTPAEIGFTGNFVANSAYAGAPFIVFNERPGLTLGNSIQGPQARTSENIQFQDALSYVIGNHRLKGGFDGVKYKQNQLFLFINQGILTFSGTNGGNTIGDDFGDFLIGNSPIAVQFGANGARDYRQKAYAGFIQDNWRVTNSLSLSYGVRYEYNSPITDKQNQVAYYRPGATSQLLAAGQVRTPSGQQLRIPAGGRAPNGLVYVGDPDPVLGGTVPRGGVKLDKNNFAPRVGLAYSFNTNNSFLKRIAGENKTVIRAGYGLYYGAIIGDTALQQLNATGFNGTNSFFFPASGTLADPFAPDPFPNFNGNQGQLPNPFTASSFSIAAPLAQFAQPIDPNLKTPQVQQFNLTLERGIGKDYVFSLAYVGNRGHKLYVREQINPSVGTFIPASARPGTTPAPTLTNGNSRRLNNDIQLGLTELTSGGNSQFDAFEANFQKRFSSDGLVFQLAYTFSKSIDDSDNQRGQLDLLDRRFARGLSNDDVPHRLVGSFIYDIPFFNKSNGFTKRLLGGFSLGGIYTYQSGNVFSVGNYRDIDGTGGAIINFADLGAPYQNVDPKTNNRQAFNADAFNPVSCRLVERVANSTNTGFVNVNRGDFAACGGTGRRGTSGRNQFRLDNPVNNFDVVLSKSTRLFSDFNNLEIRFEAFNVFNTTQFTTIDTSFTAGGSIVDAPRVSADPAVAANPTGITVVRNPNFGKFNGQRESRSAQVGIRLSF